jgi:hypothetical protein
VRADHRFDDRRGFAVTAQPDHNAFVPPFHRAAPSGD